MHMRVLKRGSLEAMPRARPLQSREAAAALEAPRRAGRGRAAEAAAHAQLGTGRPR